jgi:hypothetical protein
MCPAPGDPEALPVEILASAGTLQPGRSAGPAGPVAFALALACGRRSGNHQHPAAHVGELCKRRFFVPNQAVFRVHGPFPTHFPTFMGKTFVNKINGLHLVLAPFPNSPAFLKVRG